MSPFDPRDVQALGWPCSTSSGRGRHSPSCSPRSIMMLRHAAPQARYLLAAATLSLMLLAPPHLRSRARLGGLADRPRRHAARRAPERAALAGDRTPSPERPSLAPLLAPPGSSRCCPARRRCGDSASFCLSLRTLGAWALVRRLKRSGLGPPRPRPGRPLRTSSPPCAFGSGAPLRVGPRSGAHRRGLAAARGPAARQRPHRPHPAAARADPGPRAGPHPPPRLPGEPPADRGGDAALLPPGGVLGVAPDAHRARALLRRSRGAGLRQPGAATRGPWPTWRGSAPRRPPWPWRPAEDRSSSGSPGSWGQSPHSAPRGGWPACSSSPPWPWASERARRCSACPPRRRTRRWCSRWTSTSLGRPGRARGAQGRARGDETPGRNEQEPTVEQQKKNSSASSARGSASGPSS